MKIKFWVLTAMLALTAMAQAATNDLTGLLQKGLFDEEANRDLNAAIADYQSVAGAFDKDRQLAATAIFRLGECYRKLGKSNEAVAQYQRIIKEFGDQPTLVTLSRQNLAGMGAPMSVASNESSNELRRQMEQVQAEVVKDTAMLNTLTSMAPADLRQALPQLIPDTQLNELESELNLAQQALIKLKLNYTPDHPLYKNAEETVQDLEKKINDRINGVVHGVAARKKAEEDNLNYLKTVLLAQDSPNVEQANQTITTLAAQLENDQKRLEQLLLTYTDKNPQVVQAKQSIEADKKALAAAQSVAAQRATSLGGTLDGAAPVTDEEQQEIRRIQLMIQNSPDLINAPDNDGKTPLILAAEKGQLVVAKYLLDHGANVNARSRNHGEVPLIAAASNGHKAMVELLLSHGADVTGGGLNPLYVAASRGYVSVAEVLLANKADVNQPSGTDTSGLRPVDVAARDGKTEMLDLLINHGADVNATDALGHTPIELAARGNELPAIKILLAAKANIEAKDKEGATALQMAAGNGYANIVSLLLSSGAAVDATNDLGATALWLAVHNGHAEAVPALLEHKADPNHTGGVRNGNNIWYPSPVSFSIQRPEILKLLLDAGAKPDSLYSAIDRDQVESVRLLLDHGADPNQPGWNGSPLELAIRKSKFSVPLLLDKGADPNARNTQGTPVQTPLFLTSDPEIGRWLVEHKADVNAREKSGEGRTPLMTQVRSTNYVEFLIEAGAGVDLQDTNGNTALHYAVRYSASDSVEVLLKHKANPNVQNDAGYTPLDLAKSALRGTISAGMWKDGLGGIGVDPEREKIIADRLMQAGGLANLPKRNRIEVRRGAKSDGGIAFTKGSQDWNRYSLLEIIAGEYRLLAQNLSGDWREDENTRSKLWETDLRFPDFKNVIIYRRTDASAKQTPIKVNVADILASGDCSRDVWLEWGDIVEIPEADHPLDQQWQGLSDSEITSLTNCVARQVTLRIKGEDTVLPLAPRFFKTQIVMHDGYVWNLIHASFMLRSVLDNSKLVRVSSDLSRVKVTRVDPATKKKIEWTIDSTTPSQADLWVRDGDVIEVPEK
jgi:ankyrin repeat protein